MPRTRRRQRPVPAQATSCSVLRMPYAKAYDIRARIACGLGWLVMSPDEPLPRALELLWRDAPQARRARGLSRERIVAAAIGVVGAEGLGALSMGRVGQRGCWG